MAFTTHDNAPYLYRRSGGGGDKEIDKLVGGTIAWNQLFKAEAGGVNANVGTKTYDSTTNTFTVTNSTSASWLGVYTLRANVLSTPNHKYLIFVKATNTLATNLMFGTDTSYKVQSGFTANTEKACSAVISPTNSASFIFYFNNASSVQFRDIQIFDLTLMFGSTIADYVYSLEQSSQGSGLAWLRSYGFFTEDYYDYNSGELKSVSNLVSHDMTGKNLFDVSLGQYKALNSTTGELGADNPIRFTSALTDLPDGTYTFSFGSNMFIIGIAFYDKSGSFKRYDANNFSTTAQTFSVEREKIRLYCGSAQNHDDLVNGLSVGQLELGSTATSYEPYTLHSYPLGDVTLRGLPKLNGNALYYDGDTYESNGTVTRKYGIVDLGSLTWEVASAYSNIPYFRAHPTASMGTSTMCICSKYATTSFSVLVSDSGDKTVTTASNGGWIYIKDSAYTDAASFKTAMSGVYLVYELASSATETADTYTNPQWVDPNGTERYTLSSNAFPMPVGHETTYNTDMGSKTVNTQVNLSMTEPQVRQVYAKEGDTARVLNIHLDQTEEDGTLRILRPDGTEVTADAVLVPEFYDGLMAEIPSDATSVVGKCYCDVEQNGVSSMPFTLNVKKNERQ